MPWIYLLIAGLLEIVWAAGMKASLGFTRLGPSLVTLAAMVLSFSFLAQAVKVLPLGTAYTVWTGIGAVGTVIVGILFLQEPRDWLRLGCVFLILAGIVGLKLTAR